MLDQGDIMSECGDGGSNCSDENSKPYSAFLRFPKFSVTQATFQSPESLENGVFSSGYHRISFTQHYGSGFISHTIDYDGNKVIGITQKQSDCIRADNNLWDGHYAKLFNCTDTIDDLTQPLSQFREGLHYKYAAFSNKNNRWHLFSLSNKAYQGLHGDVLKTTVLATLKIKLQEAANLDQRVEEIKKSNDYKILATSQGLATRILGIFGKKTNSVQAFDKIVAELKESATQMH